MRARIVAVAVAVVLSQLLVPGATPSHAATPSHHRVDVFLLKFPDSPDSGLTRANVEQLMFGTSDSVQHYLNEASYGKYAISGQVHDVQTMPKPMSEYCMTHIDGFGWYACANYHDDAERLARQAVGADFTNIDRVAYVFDGFGTRGLAYPSWIELSAAINISDTVHELGHTYGLQHSGTVCGGTIKAMLDETCVPSRYTGGYDPMGVNTRHFNAVNKLELGWIDPSQQAAANTSADFEITPIETATGATKFVRVPVAGTDAYYFVEYRQPIGWDAKPPAYRGDVPPIDGLVIWQRHQRNVAGVDGSSYRAATLPAPGGAFSDASTGMTVTFLGRTAAGALVRIDRAASPPGNTPQIAFSSHDARSKLKKGSDVRFSVSVTPGAMVRSVTFIYEHKTACVVVASPWDCVVSIPKKTKNRTTISASLSAYGPYAVGPTIKLALRTVKP